MQFVGFENGDRVLDIGCGTGSLTDEIVRTTGAAKIVGIDASQTFLDYARSQYADPRLSFEPGMRKNSLIQMLRSIDAYQCSSCTD